MGTLTLKKRTARLSLDRRVVGTQAPPVDAAARVFVILSGAGDDAGAVRTIAAHTREGRRHGWRRARNSDEVKRE